MLGILLINKPLDVTSHDVVNQIRRRFGTKRVGHAGTLDPLGTGLLVIAVGPATRFLQYLPLEPKEYVAELTFGLISNTQDAEGELSNPVPVGEDLERKIAAVLPSYCGLVQQLPPMFSAVKIKGKPLYHYARKGEEIERPSRSVFIETIVLQRVSPPVAVLKVVCSGGTYVRTLAHDLGKEVGSGAYLSSLCRTRCGAFWLDRAVAAEVATRDHLLSLEEALGPMPILELSASQAALARQGQRIGVSQNPDGSLLGLKDRFGVFGIAKVIGNQLQPECVLPMEVEPNIA